jgi:tRNA A-37 threonylcarbamoyl transferase component Bud32/Tfp pilus assembly protein PilF
MSEELDGDETLLADYVQRALAQLDAQGTVDLEKLCAAHPDLQVAVGEAVGLRRLLPAMQQQAGGHDPLAGRVLRDRYRLEQRIGSGAMGAVYRATDQVLKREVAVKLLQAGVLARPEQVERFRREAETLAALRHRNVVAVHDAGATQDGAQFLVMDLLRGRSLLAALEGAPSGPAAIAAWAHDVADGLAAAHRIGVRHRDVKPSNVWITDDGRAVLLDFGIAARSDGAALTGTGQLLGSPCYLAPEQAAGRGRDDVAADVYGLGATLYHMLGGRPPYVGDAAEVLHRLAREDPVPLLTLRPGLARDLVAIAEHAMERDPSRRYQNVAALGADLEAFLAGRPVSARPLTALGRLRRRIALRPARAVAIGSSALAGLLLVAWLVVWWEAGARRWREERQRILGDATAAMVLDPRAGGDTPVPPRAEELAQLRRVVERDGDPASRLLLALARRERGEDVGPDLERVARDGGGFLGELGRRARAGGAIDLASLPAPADDDETLVAQYAALRQRAPADFPVRDLRSPAGTLHLFTLLAAGRGDLAFALALDLEGRLGRRTAVTRYVAGTALLLQKRYAEAIEPLQESVALRRDQPALHNLGLALQRNGHLHDAEAALRAAHELRPDVSSTLELLARLQMQRGRWEAAQAWIDRAGGAVAVALRADLAVEQALAAWRGDAVDESRRFADAAVLLLAEAAKAGADKDRLRRQMALARALAAGDPQGIADALLRILADEPTNPVHAANLAAVLERAEQGLPEPTVRSLRDFLLALAARLAPGDARVKEQPDLPVPSEQHKER